MSVNNRFNFNYFQEQNSFITPHFKIKVEFPFFRVFQYSSKDSTYSYLGVAFVKDDCYIETIKHFDIDGITTPVVIPQLSKIYLKFNTLYTSEILNCLNAHIIECHKKSIENDYENVNEESYYQKK